MPNEAEWPFGEREDPTKGLLVRFDERHDIAWPIGPTSGNPRRNFTPATLRKEVETCGMCHAQVSADRGSAPILGPVESRVLGAGPQIGYSFLLKYAGIPEFESLFRVGQQGPARGLE
jgi:hypothetical protein